MQTTFSRLISVNTAITQESRDFLQDLPQWTLILPCSLAKYRYYEHGNLASWISVSRQHRLLRWEIHHGDLRCAFVTPVNADSVITDNWYLTDNSGNSSPFEKPDVQTTCKRFRCLLSYLIIYKESSFLFDISRTFGKRRKIKGKYKCT